MSETRIKRAIMDALAWEPAMELYRNNSGMINRRHRAPTRYGLHNKKRKKASADLIGCVSGRFFALEVKCPGEEATEDQLEWIADIHAAGGFACVVDCVDEAMDAVKRCRNGRSE